MSTDDPKGQEAPERFTADKEEEEDTEGHRYTALNSDPDFDARTASRGASEADEGDDVAGHQKAI